MLTKGFYDLCIDVTDNKNHKKLRKLFNNLYENGYRTIAVNETIDDSIIDSDKKKMKNTEVESSLNKIINKYESIDIIKKEFNNKLIILNRLTLVFSDPAKIHNLIQQKNFLKKFHLFAVTPKGHNALQCACAISNIDIITVNSLCNGFKMNRNLYLQAISRDLYFEIQYVDLLLPENRKNIINCAHLFYIYGKGKNVIITSGAKDSHLIRNPYDIMNLANIIELNEGQGKSYISTYCKQLLIKAEGNRYGKGVFTVIPTLQKNGQSNDQNICRQ